MRFSPPQLFPGIPIILLFTFWYKFIILAQKSLIQTAWEEQTVAQTNNIPTLASLALQYGTIDNDQYRHLTALHASQKKDQPQWIM